MFGAKHVLALDEVQTTINPFTYLVGTFKIKDQKSVTINGNTGTLYHLVPAAADTTTPQVTTIIWQSHKVTLRLMIATQGLVTLQEGDVPLDKITAQPDITDSILLQTANSIAPYTCS